MPTAYALNLVEIARQQHLDLLGVAGLDEAVLEVGAYITSKIYLHIVRTFDHLSPDPAWGSDIGQRLGFDNGGNFTRACKRLLGATPQHLMRRARL